MIACSSNKVGYSRLTRFSRASTKGHELESAGATSFIIDLRNNYGGVVQEAMLTASTSLRDPHLVLCYMMNSRSRCGRVCDRRPLPGFLLSQESQGATIDQLNRLDPAIFADGGIKWVPTSTYASLHEQVMKRGSIRASLSTADSTSTMSLMDRTRCHLLEAQKNVVTLINEGTASSAEVFASACRSNKPRGSGHLCGRWNQVGSYEHC
jgi:C-terminal processing protease CtpA/Prc